MDRVIEIDGKEIKFRTSAAAPLIYRTQFGRDMIVDIRKIGEKIQKMKKEAKKTGESDQTAEQITADEFSQLDLTTFVRIAYCFAKCADKTVPTDPFEWLDQFETFSIYKILPEILQMWAESEKSTSTPKKK